MHRDSLPQREPLIPPSCHMREGRRIGLSLSGGGFRATVFHLGVLARLAVENRLEDVRLLSTVSGGSLCVGLVYARNDFRWPSSAEFMDEVLPQARDLLTTADLQSELIWRVLRAPFRAFATRSDDLSLLLRQHWGVTSALQSLPQVPHWLINATCYETGANWYFSRCYIGDGDFGFTSDTNVPLSDALAASAAFPGLVGALKFDTRGRSWYRPVRRPEVPGGWPAVSTAEHMVEPIKPAFRRLHLWDGGVYDNLGMEALWHHDAGWRSDVDFTIVSEACGQIRPEPYRPWKAADRLVRGIMMSQLQSLRLRALLERRAYHQTRGCYLQIGSTCQEILQAAGMAQEHDALATGCQTRDEATRAASEPTHIRRLSLDAFERLFRHGFEVADYTLFAFYGDEFGYYGYRPLYSGSERNARRSSATSQLPRRMQQPSGLPSTA
jgi:NTE family protein